MVTTDLSAQLGERFIGVARALNITDDLRCYFETRTASLLCGCCVIESGVNDHILNIRFSKKEDRDLMYDYLLFSLGGLGRWCAWRGRIFANSGIRSIEENEYSYIRFVNFAICHENCDLLDRLAQPDKITEYHSALSARSVQADQAERAELLPRRKPPGRAREDERSELKVESHVSHQGQNCNMM